MLIPRDTRFAEFGIETSLPAAGSINITNSSKIWVTCWPTICLCARPCRCLPSAWRVNCAMRHEVRRGQAAWTKPARCALPGGHSGAEPMEMAYACVPMYTGYAHGDVVLR